MRWAGWLRWFEARTPDRFSSRSTSCSRRPRYASGSSLQVLNASLIARLYDRELESVQFFECDNALAFKATIPRRRVQGDFGDPDLHGGQQHAPLMAVEIPD